MTNPFFPMSSYNYDCEEYARRSEAISRRYMLPEFLRAMSLESWASLLANRKGNRTVMREAAYEIERLKKLCKDAGIDTDGDFDTL